MVNNGVAACNWIVVKEVPTQRLTLLVQCFPDYVLETPLERAGPGRRRQDSRQYSEPVFYYIVYVTHAEKFFFFKGYTKVRLSF